MRAIVLTGFGGPENLNLQEIDEPSPGPGEALVRVEAAAICHRDLLDRGGAFPFLRPPIVTGHEFAGVVEALGDGVTQVKPGDRVTAVFRAPCGTCRFCADGKELYCKGSWKSLGITADGCYAEKVVVPAGALVEIPAGIAPEAAAPLMCTAGVSLHALRRIGELKMGETLLLTGASGGVGHMALQVAKLAGARVIAVTSSPSKEASLRSAGADDVIVSEDGRFQGQVLSLTGGDGADIALECVGGPTIQGTLRSLAPGGRMVVLGNVTAQPIPLNLGQLILHGRQIRGSDGVTRSELREVLRWAADGRLKPEIAEVLPLGEAAAGQERLARREVVGRLVLAP